MNDRLERAAQLRRQAEQLEREAARLLPEKWEVGMRVRYLRDREWAWSKGQEATVAELDPQFAGRKGHEYQVFWTKLDGCDGRYWTTPDDVEWIP